MSSAAATRIFWVGQTQVFEDVGNEVQDCATIVQNVVGDAQALEDANDIMLDMMLQVLACRNNEFVRNVTNLTQSLNKKIGDLQDELDPWPDQLGKYGVYVKNSREVITGLLGVPLAFLFVAFLCLLVITLLIRNLGNRSCAHCSDVSLRRIGSLPLSGTILLVAFVTALELYYSLRAGTFCYNADINVQNTVQGIFGQDSVEKNLTEYYLTGKGANPVDETLKTIVHWLTSMNVTALDRELHGACPQWNDTVMLEQMHISLIRARKARLAIKPENLYPWYVMILHQNMCGTALSNVGQLMMTQVVVGLVCMPVVSLIAAGFFARWAIWNEVLARSHGFELDDVVALERSLHIR